MSNKTVSKTTNKPTTAKKGTAPVAGNNKQAQRKETNMRFPDKHMSQKQAKMLLAGMPKHGAQSRSMAKLYLGLTDHVPGEMRPKFYKNDRRRATAKAA